MNRRWYDKANSADDVFERLRDLDDRSLAKISRDILDIVSSIKAIKRDQDELPISIGVQRVIGLYKQNKNRRWYDKQKNLKEALKAMSTLSDDEYLGILEALNLNLPR